MSKKVRMAKKRKLKIQMSITTTCFQCQWLPYLRKRSWSLNGRCFKRSRSMISWRRSITSHCGRKTLINLWLHLISMSWRKSKIGTLLIRSKLARNQKRPQRHQLQPQANNLQRYSKPQFQRLVRNGKQLTCKCSSNWISLQRVILKNLQRNVRREQLMNQHFDQKVNST